MKILITVDTSFDACQPEYTFLDRSDLDDDFPLNGIVNVPKSRIKKWKKIQSDFWDLQKELKELATKMNSDI